ncbi:MAG: DUF177 domain-containing protein [Prevotella sp.]|nr:DUF177 domain-containing protein [Prevotella sp.]
MCCLQPFKIDLKGLKEDETHVSFALDDSYFEAIDAPEVRKGNVSVDLIIRRTTDRYFDLSFHVDGEVTVQCDRCLDDMPQEIVTDSRLAVKFGDEYSEEDDLVTVPEDDGVLDTAWFIYEFIALSIPIKHVHAPGKCNRAMIETLAEHSATRSSDGAAEKTMDPRWSGLLKIKEPKD